ncbi:hypothetical protein [Variovorax sp. OV700]|uniref:hypothetical protein n=1 Tax=Variovorax sp. OV700 TaxID=1882826 RepID=UPI000B8242BE|nr:hypothetical protein [Variovorax sp. OV700]
MIRFHHLSGVLAAAVLSGCIMLPPPPPFDPPGRGPYPGFHGAVPLPPGGHAAPMAAWNVCEGQPEGARPALPGRRADALSGSCERGAGGELEFRPVPGH